MDRVKDMVGIFADGSLTIVGEMEWVGLAEVALHQTSRGEPCHKLHYVKLNTEAIERLPQ